jgi:hypothetical protein
MKESFVEVTAGRVKKCAISMKGYLIEPHKRYQKREYAEYMEEENKRRAKFPWKYFYKQLSYDEAVKHYKENSCGFSYLYSEIPLTLQYKRCVDLIGVTSKLEESNKMFLTIADCRRIGLK